MGPPTTRICQNCTILIRPSTEYNIDPRKPWTETWCPVSSNTSRPAAASACSPGLSLPFGRTQDLSLRNRTIAMRGLLPFSKTIPPAARIGNESFAPGRRFMVRPSIVSAAHAGSAYLTRGQYAETVAPVVVAVESAGPRRSVKSGRLLRRREGRHRLEAAAARPGGYRTRHMFRHIFERDGDTPRRLGRNARPNILLRARLDGGTAMRPRPDKSKLSNLGR